MFKKWKALNLFTKIMIFFGLGILIGMVMGPEAKMFNFLGTILIKLLSMVVAPLVLSLLICAAADVGEYKTLGKIGLKTFVIFMFTTAFAAAIGLVLANLFAVGKGVTLNLEVAAAEVKEAPAFIDTVIGMLPSNIFTSLSEGNLLQIIVFALLFGYALTKIGDRGDAVLSFFRGASDVMKEIVNIVLEFTPYGVFGLMANVVGNNGLSILLPYGKIILAMYIGAILHLVIIQAILMVGVGAKRSPIEFLNTMKEALLFVFATCSSVATIPITLKCVKNFGVSDKVANFVVPFGAVVNMDGTAIFQAIAAIFAAQIYGIDLTLSQQVVIVLTAVLASVGTAGVPGSGLIMLTIVLTSVGLPLEAVGLLAGIDRILNMARVLPNIAGDAATSILVAKTEGELGKPLANAA